MGFTIHYLNFAEVVPSELQLDHEYIAVDAPTPRGKRLQIKHNMLKSKGGNILKSIIMANYGKI